MTETKSLEEVVKTIFQGFDELEKIRQKEKEDNVHKTHPVIPIYNCGHCPFLSTKNHYVEGAILETDGSGCNAERFINPHDTQGCREFTKEEIGSNTHSNIPDFPPDWCPLYREPYFQITGTDEGISPMVFLNQVMGAIMVQVRKDLEHAFTALNGWDGKEPKLFRYEFEIMPQYKLKSGYEEVLNYEPTYLTIKTEM